MGFVQIAELDTSSGGTSPYSIPFGTANVAGNLLVYTQRPNGDLASAITDTLGNTWVQTTNTHIWYVKNCRGGSNTLTVTNGNTHLQASAAEWSGFGALDQMSTDATGTGTTATSPSITPSTSGCLIVSIGWNSTTNGPAITAGTGYILRSASNKNSELEDQVQIVKAPITGVSTYGASVTWAQAVMSFLPSSGGGWLNTHREFVNKR